MGAAAAIFDKDHRDIRLLRPRTPSWLVTFLVAVVLPLLAWTLCLWLALGPLAAPLHDLDQALRPPAPAAQRGAP